MDAASAGGRVRRARPVQVYVYGFGAVGREFVRLFLQRAGLPPPPPPSDDATHLADGDSAARYASLPVRIGGVIDSAQCLVRTPSYAALALAYREKVREAAAADGAARAGCRGLQSASLAAYRCEAPATESLRDICAAATAAAAGDDDDILHEDGAVIVVDTSATDSRAMYTACASASRGLAGRDAGAALAFVSANKIPFAARSPELTRLLYRGDVGARLMPREDAERAMPAAGAAPWPLMVRHESTVGAGLPILSALRRLVSAGERVTCIEGALSGSIGYVLSAVEDGKPFSQAVREARARGYTEPDVRADLSGMDVARKAVIMARAVGAMDVALADDDGDERGDAAQRVAVEPLYDAARHSRRAMPDDDEFLHGDAGLVALDERYSEAVAAARDSRKVLRYTARLEMRDAGAGGARARVTVGLRAVGAASPVGRLRGTDNIVLVHSSESYPEGGSPLVIQGAGAGRESTASGVLADVMEVAAAFRA